MRFIVGLITGAAIGVAAANLSQGQSGQDLRAEFDRIRSDLERRDFDALGAHLEQRFAQLQANLEERFREVAESAGELADDAERAAATAADEATEAVDEAAGEIEEHEPVKA